MCESLSLLESYRHNFADLRSIWQISLGWLSQEIQVRMYTHRATWHVVLFLITDAFVVMSNLTFYSHL